MGISVKVNYRNFCWRIRQKGINKTINPAPEKEAGFTDEEVQEHEEEVEAVIEVMDDELKRDHIKLFSCEFMYLIQNDFA